MKAVDIMSSPVIAVRPDAPVREVAGLLLERSISAVPVLEGERLVGLVSEADVLRRRHLGVRARRARDIMTREVETVTPDTPVEDIAALLEEHRIKRVPVMREGRVVGIVSRSNLLQALAVQPPPGAHRAQNDEAIRARLLSRLEREPWWHGTEANVIVAGGVVHYWGRADSAAQRHAARAIAHLIPGVRDVEDHRGTEGVPAAPARGPQIRRAAERGHSKHGWIDSYHSFSFGNFYDPAYTGYGPLHALNDNIVQAAKGSTTYGLSDMEIVTYVLDGSLAHEDSLNNSVTLHAGCVQCLSAGSGVRFSETNPSPSEPSRFLQIWLEPDESGAPAAYTRARFAAEAKRGRLQLVASPDARAGSLRLRQHALLYAGLFDGAERAQLEVPAERLVYVHVARGAITVQGRELGPGDGFATGGGTIALERGRDAEVLVLDLPDE
jgi:quercetin 2,3-dioxygenase